MISLLPQLAQFPRVLGDAGIFGVDTAAGDVWVTRLVIVGGILTAVVKQWQTGRKVDAVAEQMNSSVQPATDIREVVDRIEESQASVERSLDRAAARNEAQFDGVNQRIGAIGQRVTRIETCIRTKKDGGETS